MNIAVTKSEKNDIELTIDNLTLAEVLRVYLYENGADFAAWRREHPSKPLIFKIEAKDKTVKAAVADSISAIKADCDKILKAIKK